MKLTCIQLVVSQTVNLFQVVFMFEWEIVGVAFSVDEFLKYNFYQFTANE